MTFCSSLVDRITTGAPAPADRVALEAALGYEDRLLTVAEPYALWAVAGDPAALRARFGIQELVARGTEPRVIFAPDITPYRERKIRLLNGAHTSLAPIARLAGLATVAAAVNDLRLGPLLHRLIFDEIAPTLDLPADEVERFACSVVDRFSNPWLEHEWRVIATNETPKFRVRVVPSLVAFVKRFGAVPPALALALAAHLRQARCDVADGASEGTGFWRGTSHPLVDAELWRVARHWRGVMSLRAADPQQLAADASPQSIFARVVRSALSDTALWGGGRDLCDLPGLADAVTTHLTRIESSGIEGAVDALQASGGVVLHAPI